MNAWKEVTINGLWRQNPGLVQLLGLCPLLAMSNTLVNAAGLGLATVLVMMISSGLISLLRGFIPYEIRIPIYVLVIASAVTIVELMMNAWLHDLYLVLGIFIPLIVTNCIVLARVESFAVKNSPLIAIWDGALMGLGLTLVLLVLGAMRELLGQGTLFSGIDMLISDAQEWQILPYNYPGFLIAMLPAGALIGLGFIIAAYNAINSHLINKAQHRIRPAEVVLQQAS